MLGTLRKGNVNHPKGQEACIHNCLRWSRWNRREQSAIYVLTKAAIYIQSLPMQSWTLVLCQSCSDGWAGAGATALTWMNWAPVGYLAASLLLSPFLCLFSSSTRNPCFCAKNLQSDLLNELFSTEFPFINHPSDFIRIPALFRQWGCF